MEGSIQICPACGKENPVQARFCYACGAAFAQPLQQAGDAQAIELEAETQTPEAPYVQTQPQYTQPAAPAAPPPAYSAAYAPQAFPPSKPPRRGRVRCCAIGCLAFLLVLLIGLPILHVTLLRPIIEREIYKQVVRALKNVGGHEDNYYGSFSESIKEYEVNKNAQDAWSYIPGSSDGYIYLLQDQLKIEVKVYGVKVWSAADIRVNNDGEFLVKSIKMHWLLHALFSEDALKRDIAEIANEKLVRSRGLYLLAFQVSEGKLFIAYEGR
jgi:hypothetical protein